MCIVCNCDGGGYQHGAAFLSEFERARKAMADSAAAMLRCAEVAPDPDDRERYDRTHKQMVRLIRDWNRLEQQREFVPSGE